VLHKLDSAAYRAGHTIVTTGREKLLGAPCFSVRLKSIFFIVI